MTGSLPGPAPDERQQPNGRRNEYGQRVDPEKKGPDGSERAVLLAHVEAHPDVFADVIGVLSRLRFTVESISIGRVTENLSSVTVVLDEPRPHIERARKQLAGEAFVRSVEEIDDGVERELLLVSVVGDEAEVESVVQEFDGEVVDIESKTVTIELTGTKSRIENALEALNQFEVVDVVRTGATAIDTEDVI